MICLCKSSTDVRYVKSVIVNFTPRTTDEGTLRNQELNSMSTIEVFAKSDRRRFVYSAAEHHHQMYRTQCEIIDKELCTANLSIPSVTEGENNVINQGNKVLKEGTVQMTSLSTLLSHQRYLFLYHNTLVISKQKGVSCFKLKEKLRLSRVWIGSSNSVDSFLIGWPFCNYLVHFRSTSPSLINNIFFLHGPVLTEKYSCWDLKLYLSGTKCGHYSALCFELSLLYLIAGLVVDFKFEGRA
ncbi:hypothetical protein DICVIV_00427 [Dictyocaulus viviparus]|uniref:ARHGAP20 PH domain-containing protein n=1 Tax=Dictyocaulus viviparus TaxID=29172 RepID=A0A0D8YBB5_DICVI|nr:hypothetical protein DICVIV_00427 [Dictyocaulus viviparus]